MYYDFHIHSCLSPCADDDMTPANIAGFAKLAGVDAIAIADHNSALNLPAAQAACRAYGVQLLPAIETNTAEEIHLLAYLPSVEAALAMGQLLYESLPAIPYNSVIWGRQLVVDAEDNILEEPQKLLTAASSLTLYQLKALCESFGGIAVPAHIDKESTSLLSVLGLAPEDLPFEAYEISRPEHTLQKLLDAGRFPPGQELLTSSDAHRLADISEHPRKLAPTSCLRRLLAHPSPT